jgi:hypothetical protein
VTNKTGGTLTGGVWRVVSTGNISTLMMRGTPINTIATNTTVELSGALATFNVDGVLLQSSLSQNNGTLRVLNGHHFNMSNVLSNAGTVELGGPGLADATLTASTLTNTGTLMGHGTVIGNILNTSGTVSPGSSPGTLHIDGNYTQGATGQLLAELASTSSFDRLLVDDVATLNGTLSVSLASGFSPNAGDEFEIITAGTVVGTFSTEVLPSSYGGIFYDVVYDPTAVTLRIGGAAGDYNYNGVVDTADYIVWRKMQGMTGSGLAADGDGNGTVDTLDHDFWQARFGQTAATGSAPTSGSPTVPEPVSCFLLSVGALLVSRRDRASAA